ncbi:MAG TPA: glycosyltransferase [Blastocatellia bacterium]|nr:glycosyltransferase [Blastocatellia bacterium]
MRPLKILITNNGLADRAGSELYVRDLALALLKRGHTPIAYSTVLGEVAAELRAGTVPVVENLDQLSVAPDIIHGQHHLETMTALLCFPGVPAVYFCHGWLPWEEAPPKFPRILRYVAVDHTCRDRLLFEHGIPDDRVRVLLNFVDLDRFPNRTPLPAHPERALVFSNSIAESQVANIRAACQQAGIEIDVLGNHSGNMTGTPEDVLGGYDLVFAKGRAALEAMAVGAAVILCDQIGCGPMVTSDQFDRLRALNFGIRTLVSKAVTADAIARQVSQYDPRDAAKVSARIRGEAALEDAVESVEALYRETISEFEAAGRSDADAEIRAAAGYLRWISPWLKNGTVLQAERDQALVNLDRMQCELNQNQQEQSLVEERLSQPLESRDRIQAELDRIRGDRDLIQAKLDAIVTSRGWRLLSRYGAIKHRFVIPALQRLRTPKP